MYLPAAFSLLNGQKVPAVGFGTFQGEDGNSKVKDAVKLALKLGYRHIDGANAYWNEKEIGEAIRESGTPREDMFHEPTDVERALDTSLKDPRLEYGAIHVQEYAHGIFANLPHAYKAGENNKTNRHPSGNRKPVIDYDLSRRYPETWQAMEKLVNSGKARSIGLSNFNILKTQRVLEIARIVPAVNQVEIHPYFPQHELFDFSSKHGILLMAHQPLGGRPVPVVRGHPEVPFPTEDADIIEIGKKCGITPAHVCLSWLVQRGIPIVPKSVQEGHMLQNIQLQELPGDLFSAVNELSSKRGGPIRFLDPGKHLGFDIFDEEKDEPVANSAPWD
ncbi:aldo-keto reductase [Podospora didyma]|uniref:Aldo-keto reductase n=1 Tax=Podospora didyma TaxID=330526 RepID=A0AAE0U811_9PEZI|nr:aldo-keto reductase [Podospora didyma]